MAQLAPPSSSSQEIGAFWRSDGEFVPSRVTDLSRSGAFIKTPKPAILGATVHLRLDTPGREICAQAIVRRVVPGQGMAVEFESVGDEDRVRLDAMVRRIEAAPGRPPRHCLSPGLFA